MHIWGLCCEQKGDRQRPEPPPSRRGTLHPASHTATTATAAQNMQSDGRSRPEHSRCTHQPVSPHYQLPYRNCPQLRRSRDRRECGWESPLGSLRTGALLLDGRDRPPERVTGAQSQFEDYRSVTHPHWHRINYQERKAVSFLSW